MMLFSFIFFLPGPFPRFEEAGFPAVMDLSNRAENSFESSLNLSGTLKMQSVISASPMTTSSAKDMQVGDPQAPQSILGNDLKIDLLFLSFSNGLCQVFGAALRGRGSSFPFLKKYSCLYWRRTSRMSGQALIFSNSSVSTSLRILL